MRKTPIGIVTAVALAGSVCVGLPAQADSLVQTSLTAKLSTTRLTVSAHPTLTGVLTTADDSHTPLPGEIVTVVRTNGYNQSGVNVVTDESGKWSYSIPVASGDALNQSFYAQFGGDLSHTESTSPSVSGIEPVGTSFSDTRVTMDAWGDVSATGNLSSADGNWVETPVVHLQYSPDKVHWATKKSVSSYGSFSMSTVVNSSGYWRVTFAGSTDYLASSSSVKETWRWNSHFTGFKVKRVGSRIRATGRLVRWFSAKHEGGYKYRNVEIIFRFKGKKTWYKMGWAKTNSKGYFTYTHTRYGKAYYLALFRGAKGVWATETNRMPLVALPLDNASASDLSINLPKLLQSVK